MPKNLGLYTDNADIPRKKDIPAYSIATDIEDGLMSSEMVLKLEGIENGANAKKPIIDTAFASTITPTDNTIYVWTMDGDLTITTSANNCLELPAHFMLYTGDAVRTLTISGAVVMSGDDYTGGLEADERWEISILRGQVLIKNLSAGLS